MTGCIYISPGAHVNKPHPCLISDTRVTSDSFETHQILPHQLIGDLPKLQGLNYTARPTVKKCFPISERTALAVSGEQTVIKKFIETCKGEILSIEMNEERPMRKIGDLANKFRRDSNGDLGVIGASIQDSKINVLDYDCHKDDDLLGQISAVGSGSQDLLDKVTSLSIHFSNNTTDPPMEMFEFIRGFCSTLTANRLVEEIMIKESRHNQWGSMLEYLYYRWDIKKWDHGLPRAFIVIFATGTGENELSIGLSHRIVLYNPGRKQSRYCTILLPEFSFFDWVANDIFDDDYDPNHEITNPHFWVGWRPDQFTITIVPDGTLSRPANSMPKFLTVSKTTDNLDFHKITINIGEKESYINIGRSLLEGLGESYAQKHGYTFKRNGSYSLISNTPQPHSTLTPDVRTVRLIDA